MCECVSVCECLSVCECVSVCGCDAIRMVYVCVCLYTPLNSVHFHTRVSMMIAMFHSLAIQTHCDAGREVHFKSECNVLSNL